MRLTTSSNHNAKPNVIGCPYQVVKNKIIKMKTIVNGIEIELTPAQVALVSPAEKEKLRVTSPLEDKWIDCNTKMPLFYKDNVISNQVWAKGADGKIIENAGLFKSTGKIVSYGLTQKEYHPNITHWQPLYENDVS
jgi:hypothetical protein